MSTAANGPPTVPDVAGSPGQPTPARPGEADRLGRARRLLILGGLVAGLAAFGIGEATYNIIPARPMKQPFMGKTVSAVTPVTQLVADLQNASLAFAILGACLGATMGLVGGLARRSIPATATAALLGLCLGAAMAGGVSLATLRWFDDARFAHPTSDIGLSFLMHAMIWGLCGASAGVAFAIGLGGGWRRIAAAKLAGLAGAVAGSVAFDLIGGILFPLDGTGDPVSTTWASRLTARLLVALGVGVAISLSLGGPRSAPVDRGHEPSNP